MEIPQLKAQLSILDVARHLGIEVDKQGKTRCPFHDDKTPSLQFSKEKNIATCFSSKCSAGTMDIIGLTEKYLKLTTHQAILQLKAWAGLPGEEEYSMVQEPMPLTEGEQLEKIALLTKFFRYCENGLRNSRKGKEYLDKRGLVQSSPTQAGIETGYNSGSFHNRANKHLITTLLKYGLLQERQGEGYTAFAKDSLVFPLKNSENKIVSLYFRLISGEGINRHLYMRDRQGLYPEYPRPRSASAGQAQPETQKLILTESVIDAATLLQLPALNGYEILACYGSNSWSKEHVTAIKALQNLSEIIIFFDGDEGGNAGASRLGIKLQQLFPQLTISQVETPEMEDINSLYVSHLEKAEELFSHLIGSRVPVKKTFFPSTETSSEKETPLKPTTRLNTSNPHKITWYTGMANYYVIGGLRQELDSLRVSLMIENLKGGKYRNKLDLYENKQVERVAREASEKLGLRADLLELELQRLTDLLEEHRDSQLARQENKTPVTVVDSQTGTQCKTFLSQSNLIKRINELIGQAGVVGEENNRIFLFCLAASCRMADTLHGLIQGSSGSGKTHLLMKVSSFIPEEDVKRFTRVTDSSFYNYGMYELQNKLICLEDLDGMKEEAQLAFRELQSREILSSSTTGQDEKGNIRSFEKIVYGPIASLACTTKGEIYEDNMSRCFLIAVDETREQTQRIIEYQNKKAAGLIDERKEEQITGFIRNCVRMLKPMEVINPYAARVQLPREAHKIRRLNDLYQSFVKQVTLINQYRRKKDERGRLITEKEDLQVAAEIMFDSIVLKIDELDGSLRLFYEELKMYIRSKGESYQSYSFGQRELRQMLHLSKSQLQRYVNDLLSLEYIHLAGGHINKGYRYKVVYWDDMNNLKGKVKRHLQGQLDQLEINLACQPK